MPDSKPKFLIPEPGKPRKIKNEKKNREKTSSFFSQSSGKSLSIRLIFISQKFLSVKVLNSKLVREIFSIDTLSLKHEL
jgi:hypothetical protein